jgi:hypothetical protein
MSVTKKIKVLCILSGFGRSGSTLLTSILSQIEGVHSLGETSFLPREAANPITLCTCGKKTPDCDYWGQVINSFDDYSKSDWENLSKSISHQTRTRWMLFGFPKNKRFINEKNHLRDYLKRLILKVAAKDQDQLIVEDSKSTYYANILSEIEEIDLYCVQLIRDPRAVCHSWTKRVKIDPNAEIELPRFSTLKVALIWTLWNITGLKQFGKKIGHFAILRYEDLINSPIDTVNRIGQFVGLNFKTDPWLTESSYQILNERHLFAGNPNRFNHGVIPFCLDEKWKTQMLFIQQKIVNFIGRFYFRVENSKEYKNVTRL